MRRRTPIFGVMAEFREPDQILRATRQARAAGYTVMDAYTPYPVEGLADELGLRRTRIPFVVLVAGFAALLGMLLLNGLPRPYHPVFNVPRFVEASRYRFFLCIEATDPRFDRRATEAFLESLNPAGAVAEVPH